MKGKNNKKKTTIRFKNKKIDKWFRKLFKKRDSWQNMNKIWNSKKEKKRKEFYKVLKIVVRK